MDQLDAAGENTEGQQVLDFGSAGASRADRRNQLLLAVDRLVGGKDLHFMTFIERVWECRERGQPLVATIDQLCGPRFLRCSDWKARATVKRALTSGLVRAEPTLDDLGRPVANAYHLVEGSENQRVPCSGQRVPFENHIPQLAPIPQTQSQWEAPRAGPPIPIPRKISKDLQFSNSSNSNARGTLTTRSSLGPATVGDADSAALLLALAETDPSNQYDRWLREIWRTVPSLNSPSANYIAREAARLVARGDVPVADLRELLMNIRNQRASERGVEGDGALLFHWTVKRWPGWRQRESRPREPSEPGMRRGRREEAS